MRTISVSIVRWGRAVEQSAGAQGLAVLVAVLAVLLPGFDQGGDQEQREGREADQDLHRDLNCDGHGPGVHAGDAGVCSRVGGFGLEDRVRGGREGRWGIWMVY